MPTAIKQTMQEYLEEQKQKLAPRTYSYHVEALGFFEHSLNGYGPNGLDEKDYKKWESNYDKGIEYCETFGPEFIDDHDFAEFLGYFYPKKVAAGRDRARKVCGAAINYFKWMVRKEYITLEDGGEEAELSETVKYLRRAFDDGINEFNGHDEIF